jgi:hypothetical protein
MIIIEQMENNENKQDFTSGATEVLTKTEPLLIKSKVMPTNRGRKKRSVIVDIATNDSWQSLTDRAKHFCAHYVGSNPRVGVDSAIAAGYTGNTRQNISSTASHLLNDPRIISYCKFLMSKTNLKLGYSREGQLQKISKFLEGCMEKGDAYNASRLIDIENKLLSLYQPQTQISMAATGDIKVTFGTDNTSAPSTTPEQSNEQPGSDNNLDFTDGGQDFTTEP